MMYKSQFRKLTLKTGFVVQGHILPGEDLEKHISSSCFHPLSCMLVIQLSYSDSGMPVKSYYYFSYESVLDFLRESAPPASRMNETYNAWECSALRDVHIVLDTNITYPNDVTIFSLLI